MKDFTFSDESGSVNITYRTSLIGTDGAFTILQHPRLDDDPTKTFRDKKLAIAFKRLPYSVNAFITFAAANKLKLVMADSNGANSVILSRQWAQGHSASDSDSGS